MGLVVVLLHVIVLRSRKDLGIAVGVRLVGVEGGGGGDAAAVVMGSRGALAASRRIRGDGSIRAEHEILGQNALPCGGDG